MCLGASASHISESLPSSFHLHSSLWNEDGSDSLMWDADAPKHMSETFRHYLGGLISTGRELAWMFAPYVNSYKRYQPESWAPTVRAWAPTTPAGSACRS